MPKKRVLVVENETGNIDVLTTQLEFLGYEVLVAMNGQQGVEKAISELPDLIIMDILMPKMDGYEATKLIKQDPRTQHIPILAATAKAMPGDRKACLEAGCDDYIAKPIAHKELGEAIESLLAKQAGEKGRN